MPFTYEGGNGWGVLENGKLTALFTNTAPGIYSDRITTEVIHVSDHPLILGDIGKTGDERYIVVFYKATDSRSVERNADLYVISRSIS